MRVAGVDSSTQSCTVVVDADSGAELRRGRAPHPSGTEVDPEAWWHALVTAIREAGGLDDVEAVSIAGQQHGMVCLDESGTVIRPALLWNDTRSATAAHDLVDEAKAGTQLNTGDRVIVAGSIVTDSWNDADTGENRYQQIVLADAIGTSL